ncbi:MAG: ATP-binding protein, partial [Cyanobacteria bacterium P01_H01_bin.58]
MGVISPQNDRWYVENRRYVMDWVAQIGNLLQQRLDPQSNQPSTPLQPPPFPEDLPPPALVSLSHCFGLSGFERNILLLCVSAALSRTVGQLCATLHGNEQQTYPSFSLALMLFAEGNWPALTPDRPLRRWRLVEIMPGAELTYSPLRIDERILHTLMGVSTQDDRLQGTVQKLLPSSSASLPPSYQKIAQQIVELGGWQTGYTTPVVQLCGLDGATKRAIAFNSATQAGLALQVITAEALPTELSQASLWQRLCEREALLTESGLVLDCDMLPTTVSGEGHLTTLKGVIARFIETCDRPLVIFSQEPLSQRQRPLLKFDITAPEPQEQRQLWHTYLGDHAALLNGHIDRLVTYFNLGPPAIQRACLTFHADVATDLPEALPLKLWQACLVQARPRLGELAQHIPATTEWDDLVLPDKELQVLKTLT